MTRVAFDVGALHGHRTGVGNAVTWLLDALEDHDGVDIVPYVTSLRAPVSPPERRLPLPAAFAHRLWGRVSQPPMDRWLGSPDVVHGTNYVVAPARCARVVSVYDCWFLEHLDLASPDVRRAGDALRRAVADGAHVVTSSAASTDRVRSLLQTERVRTIHLGPPRPAACATNASRPADPQLAERFADRRFVLSLGTIERRKNLPVLAAAFERVAAEVPEVVLAIAGASGDAAAELDRQVAGLDPDVAGRIVRLGPVDEPSKRWLLQHATVLAYPSRDEGFGFPILEAQQSGVPVVASSAGSIPEVAGNGALLSLPDDVEALAANLHWALTSEEVRERLVGRGRANLARFSWAATADAYVTMYRELAGLR